MRFYNLFKLLHVACVITWVGSATLINILSARASRSRDAGTFLRFADTADFAGRRVMAPFAALTVVTGVTLAGISRTFTFWMGYGLTVAVIAAILGGAVLGKIVARVATGADPDALDRARRQIGRLGVMTAALLYSVVAVMVFKPTL